MNRYLWYLFWLVVSVYFAASELTKSTNDYPQDRARLVLSIAFPVVVLAVWVGDTLITKIRRSRIRPEGSMPIPEIGNITEIRISFHTLDDSKTILTRGLRGGSEDTYVGLLALAIVDAAREYVGHHRPDELDRFLDAIARHAQHREATK